MSMHYSNAYFGGEGGNTVEATTTQWQAFVDSQPTQQHSWGREPAASAPRWMRAVLALVFFLLAAATMAVGVQTLISAGVDVLAVALPLLALFLSGALCTMTIFTAVES